MRPKATYRVHDLSRETISAFSNVEPGTSHALKGLSLTSVELRLQTWRDRLTV